MKSGRIPARLPGNPSQAGSYAGGSTLVAVRSYPFLPKKQLSDLWADAERVLLGGVVKLRAEFDQMWNKRIVEACGRAGRLQLEGSEVSDYALSYRLVVGAAAAHLARSLTRALPGPFGIDRLQWAKQQIDSFIRQKSSLAALRGLIPSVLVTPEELPELPGFDATVTALAGVLAKCPAPVDEAYEELRVTSALRGQPEGSGTKARSHQESGRAKEKPAIRRSRARALTVANIIKELDILRPQIYGATDYERLAKENPNFMVFQVVDMRPDLKEKVLNVQDSRRHIRLAQEIAGAKHGRTLSTIQTDWKKHKPKKFRQKLP